MVAIDNDGMAGDTIRMVVKIRESSVGVLDYDPTSVYNSDKMIVAPMPIQSKATVMFNAEIEGVYNFTLYTSTEFPMLQQSFDLDAGEHELPLKGYDKLPSGIYYLEMSIGDEKASLIKVYKTK